ncbi:hypothetical protein CR51_22850 [Caballeronia megalochromosomata]|nr:hypothetical protein CR51_22850 [Caballeronia megalochromosomata]
MRDHFGRASFFQERRFARREPKMAISKSYTPLAEDEISGVAEFLHSFGRPAMHIETIDGYLP